MPKDVTPATRNWCFTIFADDDQLVRAHFDKFRYISYQFEICPDTGRTHIQGYLQLREKQRLSWLKKLFPTAHFEVQKGTNEQARDYTRKESSRKPDTLPVEHGVFVKGSGARSDLAQVAELLKQGKDMRTAIEGQESAFIKYHKGLSALQQLYNQTPRTWMTELRVYWGSPGTGKSRRAFEEAGEGCYVLPAQSKGSFWADGYTG